jgi:hypothetical protein
MWAGDCAGFQCWLNQRRVTDYQFGESDELFLEANILVEEGVDLSFEEIDLVLELIEAVSVEEVERALFEGLFDTELSGRFDFIAHVMLINYCNKIH